MLPPRSECGRLVKELMQGRSEKNTRRSRAPQGMGPLLNFPWEGGHPAVLHHDTCPPLGWWAYHEAKVRLQDASPIPSRIDGNIVLLRLQPPACPLFIHCFGVNLTALPLGGHPHKQSSSSEIILVMASIYPEIFSDHISPLFTSSLQPNIPRQRVCPYPPRGSSHKPAPCRMVAMRSASRRPGQTRAPSCLPVPALSPVSAGANSETSHPKHACSQAGALCQGTGFSWAAFLRARSVPGVTTAFIRE